MMYIISMGESPQNTTMTLWMCGVFSDTMRMWMCGVFTDNVDVDVWSVQVP